VVGIMSLEDIVYDLDNYKNLSIEELYKEIHTREARKILIDKYDHNPKEWIKYFNNLVNIVKDNPSKRSEVSNQFRGLRILIQIQTLLTLKNMNYKIFNNNNNCNTIYLN